MGAWIEIPLLFIKCIHLIVAPFMGAWIEIRVEYSISEIIFSRTLYGCVD